MCINNDPFYVKMLLKRKSKYIIGYKIVMVKDSNLVGPFYSHFKYKSGINKSNSIAKVHNVRNVNISRGIYVYHTKKRAESICESYNKEEALYRHIVVPIKCYLKDLIASTYHISVFKKVYLSKHSYNNTLKNKYL